MTLEELKRDVRALNPRHINREVDSCDWTINGLEIIHERSRHPWSPFKQMTVSYWTHVTYTDKALADSDAARLGGHVEMHFYCDEENPAWFLIFKDLDQALTHCLEHL